MKKTKTKCYLYTRVSTSMQVDGYSLDAQRDKLRKYAEYEDMVVAGEYSDEGFSGKNIQGRHEFQRMLQDIQDCKDGVEYVLVFKLSRFGRNAADVLNSLQLMQDFGVNLICVEDGIDSSKDSGKLMISVLSAVAEIERENIRTQTMAGREQKAREGKWNGGFAPYGYRLEKGELLIAEDEVDVIRTIFDRYIHTNDGVSGVAKYLNRQGFVKKLRQNGTIPGFSASFVKNIIDNPVYMGKIAYGRRRTEKKIGTRNEMHVVEQSEFPVYEGKHEAIISEEDWNLAQEKRKINAYRREKVNDPTHAHILSGILKCPCCGKSLYGNIAKAHSKDKKTRYYYYCKNTVTPTGHECTFRLNIEQTEMNRMVASIISAMVSDPRFADAIKAKIGSAVDTNDLEKQLEALQAQLRQTLGTKTRLERQMDGLDVNDPYYDRKISDLQRRYDEQYGRIDEIEVQIDDVQSQIRSIRQEKISGDNIYRLLLAFDQVYEAASEVERKEFMRAFIERIELFPEKQPDGNWIRKIIFNFPVPVNGTEVKELPLENETIVDYVLLLAENNTIDLAFMPKDKTVYSLHESVLLIILAALDKVYDADAIALGIPMYEVGTFITKVGEKLAQRELCSPDEATKHSAMKLVHNSKFALLKIVNGLDEEQVIESVFHIVQRCQHDYTRKRLYINVMLFDTLNQLFQDSPKRAELIKKIYDKLSELLYSDMHYWLQRAKCTYRYAKEQSALETAYTYAKKSYDDGGQDIHYKASLTLSIICCAISEHEKGQDKINECRLAIRYANEAVFSDFYQQNNTSLQLDLDAKQGKSHSGIQMVVNACNFIKQNSTDMEDVEISESVLDRLHKLSLEKNS